MKLALLLACCTALPVSAATLRPFTSLPDPVVRLSDLFEGVSADRPIGPSPAPGNRIVVEAAQLTAIARQFGVDWRPASPADRAVLERPGRLLGREEVLEPLRTALEGVGAAREADLELGALNAPPIPAGAAPRIDVTQTEFDAATGRFTAVLTVGMDGASTLQVRVSGRVQDMIELPVTRRRMLPGDIVAAVDLQWARVRATLARGEVVHAPVQAIGQAVRHSVPPGQPIQMADLGRPVVVQKGAAMVLSLEGPGIEVTAKGIATEPGGIGDRIHVLNPLSRVAVEAEITGPRQARVIPGTAAPSTLTLAAAR